MASAYLGCPLDLKAVAHGMRNAEYTPKRFSAVIIRILDPKSTCLAFQSGKIVVTGTKSAADAQLAARKHARLISKLNFPVKFLNFKLRNFVGVVNAKVPLRLEALANAYHKFCTYEPELFPGLVYRMTRPEVVGLVFVSGKVVLTGAKSEEEAKQAWDNLYPVLKKFQKVGSMPPPSSTGGAGRGAKRTAAGATDADAEEGTTDAATPAKRARTSK